jgi:hypothetical protein
MHIHTNRARKEPFEKEAALESDFERVEVVAWCGLCDG